MLLLREIKSEYVGIVCIISYKQCESMSISKKVRGAGIQIFLPCPRDSLRRFGWGLGWV